MSCYLHPDESGSVWRSKGTFPLCEVWSADRETLGFRIPACPEWWDQLFKPLLLLFSSIASPTHCSAGGWPDSPRFSTAAVVLRQAAVLAQFLSFPALTLSVLSSPPPELLSACLPLSLQHLLSFFLCPPSPPWSRVICRMLKPRMLCCSDQPLVLLTTEVEWESAEEIENPTPPTPYSSLHGFLLSPANGRGPDSWLASAAWWSTYLNMQ